MGTRRAVRAVARAAAAMGLVAGAWLTVAPAEAEPASSLDDLGWWSRVNQNPTIGGVLLVPDVTPGQLLVEGTPEGATAIAALRATLPEGTGNPVLTLRAASAVGGEAAVLLACQSGSGWTGAHGGAWDAKPSPDCSQSVQGIPSEDGTEWSFALAPLQFTDQIDVVLTPGAAAEGQDSVSSAFRIVFDRPSAASIEVSDSTASAPPAISPVSLPGPIATPDTSPSLGGGATSSFTPPSSSGGQVSAPPARAALPEAEQGATATAPNVQAAQPLAAPSLPSTGSDGRLLGVLVVLAAGALLYWSSQQPVPQRQVLSRFASAAPTTAATVVPAEAPTVGGLGRFRRERTGAARRLGG